MILIFKWFNNPKVEPNKASILRKTIIPEFLILSNKKSPRRSFKKYIDQELNNPHVFSNRN